jgi:hypothetical protein
MGSFAFKLEHEDGTPADPPKLHTAYRTGGPATRSRSARTGCFASSRSGKRQSSTRTLCSWSRKT